MEQVEEEPSQEGEAQSTDQEVTANTKTWMSPLMKSRMFWGF